MRARTPKRQRQERAYARLRLVWLAEHPWCERCGAAVTDLHHKQGRDGARLLAAETFMAACNPCHRHIHMNPSESYRQGWMHSRVGAA